MPFDKTKNQRKGFCFITFGSEQVVNQLLKTPKQTINGKAVSLDLFAWRVRGGGQSPVQQNEILLNCQDFIIIMTRNIT